MMYSQVNSITLKKTKKKRKDYLNYVNNSTDAGLNHINIPFTPGTLFIYGTVYKGRIFVEAKPRKAPFFP